MTTEPPIRRTWRNFDQSLEVLLWDHHEQNHLILRSTTTERQLSCTAVGNDCPDDELEEIAALLLYREQPWLYSDAAAIQAAFEGRIICCATCDEPLKRTQGLWQRQRAEGMGSDDHNPAPLVFASPLGLAPERHLTDAAALDGITRILRRPEWSGADDLQTIWELVNATGRSTAAPGLDDG